MIHRTKIIATTLFVITAWRPAFAANDDLHFWPTAISVPNPEEHGALFMWPEYRVLLQTKNGSSYSPAHVDEILAAHLAELFTQGDNAVITQQRDQEARTWGLAIPGGERLREQNRELIPAMAEKFTACLATLTDEELALMKEVLYAPLSFLDPTGGVFINDEYKRVAAKLAFNFQTNRCENARISVPELVQKRSHYYLSVLLTGKADGIVEPSGSLLVITTLFRDMLFSAKGIWVRTTLAALQKFIDERLALLPALNDENLLEQDYENFLDFVLLSRHSNALSYAHYLSIAKAFGVDGIADVFKSFPLKQKIASGQVKVTHITLGSRSSTVFFAGAQQ